MGHLLPPTRLTGYFQQDKSIFALLVGSPGVTRVEERGDGPVDGEDGAARDVRGGHRVPPLPVALPELHQRGDGGNVVAG